MYTIIKLLLNTIKNIYIAEEIIIKEILNIKNREGGQKCFQMLLHITLNHIK